jgi:hypothetical protein
MLIYPNDNYNLMLFPGFSRKKLASAPAICLEKQGRSAIPALAICGVRSPHPRTLPVHGSQSTVHIEKGGRQTPALRCMTAILRLICLIRLIRCEFYFTSIIRLVSVKSPVVSL